MTNVVHQSNFTSWMQSIIHKEKEKLLSVVSQEHNISMEELLKLNTITVDVQKYLDTYNDNPKSKPKKEKEISTSSSKSKKNRDIDLTNESILKMKAPDMKYLLKEVYNDPEGASMNAKTKEDKEIMRQRLLNHYQESNTDKLSTDESNTPVNSEDNTDDKSDHVTSHEQHDTEPNTLVTSDDKSDHVTSHEQHDTEPNTLVTSEDKSNVEVKTKTEDKSNVEVKTKTEDKSDHKSDHKSDVVVKTKSDDKSDDKSNVEVKTNKKKVIKPKKKSTDVDTVTTEDYNQGLDIYYNSSTKKYTISSFETEPNWLEYRLIHKKDTYYLCTENRKILKKINIKLTQSNQEFEDEYEEFTSNDDITEDKVGNIFINGDQILLSEERSQATSGYKSHFVVGKFILSPDSEDEELTEDTGDDNSVFKILNITEAV